jgi:hypothetical protein
LTISALAGGFGWGAGDGASERAGGCAAARFTFGDEDELTADTDGCEGTLGALAFAATVAVLVFGVADSVGFGADAVEASFIGGELPGVLGVEDVVLASFAADVLGAGWDVFFAAPFVALDEAEAGGTGWALLDLFSAAALDEAGFVLNELGWDVRESRDPFAPAEFDGFAGGAAIRELAEEPSGALDAALVDGFAGVADGGVFFATRLGALDDAVAADGVTGCDDAGFAAVADEGEAAAEFAAADLGADAASGWADGVS